MSTMGSNCTIVVYRCTIIWRTIGQHARNDETRRSVHALVICYFSAVPYLDCTGFSFFQRWQSSCKFFLRVTLRRYCLKFSTRRNRIGWRDRLSFNRTRTTRRSRSSFYPRGSAIKKTIIVEATWRHLRHWRRLLAQQIDNKESREQRGRTVRLKEAKWRNDRRSSKFSDVFVAGREESACVFPLGRVSMGDQWAPTKFLRVSSCSPTDRILPRDFRHCSC